MNLGFSAGQRQPARCAARADQRGRHWPKLHEDGAPRPRPSATAWTWRTRPTRRSPSTPTRPTNRALWRTPLPPGRARYLRLPHRRRGRRARARHPAVVVVGEDNFCLVHQPHHALHAQHAGRACGHAHGCHHLTPALRKTWPLPKAASAKETIAAEDILHDLGAISMMSSDSQAMGRVGEVILRTWQTAHKMKVQRGALQPAGDTAARTTTRASSATWLGTPSTPPFARHCPRGGFR